MKPIKTMASFQHKGFDCLVLEGTNTYNGYIRLPKHHPWVTSITTDDPYSMPVDVHGGITFGREIKEPDTWSVGFWIGFDTNHFGDNPLPHLTTEYCYVESNGHTWTVAEVATETKRLAEQAYNAVMEVTT